MASIFSKIVNGEIPCYKVMEDHEFLAFLDINPLVPGHTLVIPKEEIDYIFDIEDALLSRLHVFAKKVANKMDKVLSCERIGVSVIGLEVPHAHIHLIPMNRVSDMDFSKPKIEMTADAMARLAEKISKA
ncbi:MAG: HIT family protein [Flavobacteriales bacterium]|nr:HIT family protein [Flavobacteriales bacterium]NNK80684.1 HIT family protein [Flavobacteriales bacterium]